MNKYKVGFCEYTENELWQSIVILSGFKVGYSPFDAEERHKYLAYKVAIDAIKKIMGVDKM